MPKVSEQHIELRKKQVLAAAIICFARSGLQGATMDDICSEAGLSKGAVYGYFKSKDDIITALKVESVQRDAAVIRSATQNGYPETALADMLASTFRWLDVGGANSHQRVDVLLWAEALMSQRMLDAQHLETQLWEGAIDLLVQQAQRRGVINPRLGSLAVSRLLTATLYGCAVMKTWNPDFEADELTEVVHAMVAGKFNSSSAAA